MSIPQYNIDWSRYMEGLDGKADRDLGNLNIATNCITEIPQDIQLDLKDGAIVVRSGSKLTNLDGTTRVLKADMVHSLLGYGHSQKHLLISHPNFGSEYLQTPAVSTCYSGTGYPNIKHQQYMYYLGTNNKHFYFTNDTGTSWEDRGVGSVLGVVTSDTTKYISIDQVFNGFGYIGSTMFSLPGIKGLAPDGRNADGSLRNYEFISKEVRLNIYTYTTPGPQVVCLSSESLNRHGLFTVSETRPAEAPWCAWLNTKENIIYYSDEDGKYINTSKETLVVPVITTGSDFRITSFKVRQPLQITDFQSSPHLIHTYVNGTSGYRIWSDGYCEQWGSVNTSRIQVNLLKKYKDINYNVSITTRHTKEENWHLCIENSSRKNINSFYIDCQSTTAWGANWHTWGYLAEGEY